MRHGIFDVLGFWVSGLQREELDTDHPVSDCDVPYSVCEKFLVHGLLHLVLIAVSTDPQRRER